MTKERDKAPGHPTRDHDDNRDDLGKRGGYGPLTEWPGVPALERPENWPPPPPDKGSKGE